MSTDVGPYCALTPASEPLPDHLFEHLLEAAPDAVVIIDAGGEIILVNAMVTKMFGYTRAELIGHEIECLMPERFRKRHVEMRALYTANPTTRPMGGQLDLIALKKSGEEVPTEISLSPIYTERGLLITAIIRDISDRKKAEEALKKTTTDLVRANQLLTELSNLDPLTETLNRRGLETVLLRETQVAVREGNHIAAVLIDVDDFKSINETHGHAVGDQVLRGIAERIRHSLRSSDYLARVGGDEFVILMPATKVSDATDTAQRVCSKVASSPLSIGTSAVPVTISCGLVGLPNNIVSMEEVLVHSRVALKTSKTSGKNRVAVGNLVTGTGTTAQMTLNEALESLKPGAGLRAVSQPIYRLSDRRIVAREVFVRGPNELIETPADIFRIAREHEILSVVDLNCLKSCLHHCQALPPESTYHVNLLPQTLKDIPLQQVLAPFANQQDGRNYCIELSEQHFFGDPLQLQEPVRHLKKAGIKIAIDDVCFGLSSLEVLILLEPDLVKLDIHYVQGVARDQRKQRAVRRLIQVAFAIGCEIVAEGIEREDDLDTLTELGADYGQGFFWGQPA
jgi:diguanylate cyclase (GGDEF)-like protein/PAS domain S-box-containing protein